MVIVLPGYSRARLPSIWSGYALAGTPDGGINRREVVEAPNENRGEVEDVLDDDAGCGTETETEGEVPNTAGRFGREEGSVL